MLSWSLAWKLFWRDWKSGELRVLMFALWVAIGGLSAVTLLVDRVDRGMTKEAAQVLGADLVVSSPRPFEEKFAQKADELALNRSDLLWFSSVIVAGEEFHLATVRAVDDKFPLAGRLEISEQPFTPGQLTSGAPKAGEVWLSTRLLHLLKVSVGESVQVGVRSFKVGGVIVTEPGGSSFFNFSPTIMMGLADVPSTNIVQPGSRLNYRMAITGDEYALEAFSDWSEGAVNTSQRVLGVQSGAPALGSALGRAKNYLNLSGVLGLLLGGIAIAIAANRYAMRHFDHSALLRCMGLKKNQVVWIFCLVLFMAGFVGSLLGVISGLMVSEGLVFALGDLLPDKIPSPGVSTLLVSLVTGLTVLLGFALPALLKIRAVAPMRILRRDLEPMALSQWLVIGIAVIAMGCILFWYSSNLKLVLAIILGGSVLMSICLSLSFLLLSFARWFGQKQSIAFKFGVEHLSRHRSASLIQISAFGLTLTLLLTILLVRNELIADWQAQLPSDAPNHFLVNLQPEDVTSLNQYFDKESIVAADLFPMVRGRVVALNGEDPKKFLSVGSRGHNSLRRDLNLTWSDTLPTSNQVLEGEWNMSQADEAVISIEEKMADDLGLTLGDTIGFNIAGETVTGKINSIRKVDWDSFHPNFFVIFNESALQQQPSTYITSFFLPSDRKLLLNDIIQRYPTVSIIELDLILTEVRKVLDQASLAIEVVLVFVIFAGLAVLFATTRATLDEKLYESAILKTLGANKQFVRKTTFVEYWVLGLLSGLLAAIAAEGLAYLLYRNIFQIDTEFHWWLWLSAPLLGLLIVVPAGIIGNRRVLTLPPAIVLRQT